MSLIQSKLRPNYMVLIFLLMLALLGRWSASRADRIMPNEPVPDMSIIPYTFDDWIGAGSDLDDLSKRILNPETYLVRSYKSYTNDPAEDVELLVTYGHAKSNFHSPANCFLGSGWAIAEKSTVEMPTGGGSVSPLEMARMELTKGEDKAIVLYTFLSPGQSTASWSGFQTRLLKERLMGRKPPGALLRLVIQVRGTEQAANETAERFLKGIYPSLHRALKL
jgi:EpsI family protein